jgi:hypothetical protein
LKSVTLAFEGMDAKGGRLDLATIENVLADMIKTGSGHSNDPLGFCFKGVAIGMTVVSKVEMPLPIFLLEAISAEEARRFPVKVKTDAERILGSYGPREHDACVIVKLPNSGCLNYVFEQIRVPYALRPLSGMEASQSVTSKRKTDISKNMTAKKPKLAQRGKAALVKMTPPKRIVIKVDRLRAKPGLRGTSQIEFILVKPIGVPKNFTSQMYKCHTPF